MKLTSLYILVLSLFTTYAFSKSNQNKAHLQLRGVVPVHTSVQFNYSKDGVLVPTLNSNAPHGHYPRPKLRTLRAPASLGGATKLVIAVP